MTSKINALTGSGGVAIEGDSSGILEFQSNGTTVMTVSSASQTALNRIINGDMKVDQRNAGSAATVSSDYTVDRWKFQEGGSGGQVVSVQQVTDAPVGFSNSFKLTNTTASSSITADAYNMFWQAVEGLNWSDLEWGTSDAKTVTISFWVKASIAGNYSLAIRSSTNDRSYVTPYTISSASTWEYKTITIPGPTSGTFNTDNTKAIQVAFTNSMGSNYTSSGNDAWQSESKLGATGTQVALTNTINSTWQVTGVQLEEGAAASNFEYLQYSDQLQLCQRYYYQWNTSSANNFLTFGMGVGTTALYGEVPFPTTMRTNPSSINFGSGWGRWLGGALTSISTIGIAESGNTSITLNFTTTGVTAEKMYGVLPGGATNYIGFNSEL